MNKFQELKSSFEQTNKKWEARINAVENQMQLSKEKAIDRAEEMKIKYEESLDTLASRVDNIKEYNEDKRNTLKSKIENLKVQLALGKMDTKSKYQENKKKIHDAINDFDALMESDYDLATEELAKEWLEDSVEFEEELNALDYQFQLEDEEMQAEFEANKQKLQNKVAAFKAKVMDKGQEAKHNWEETKAETEKEFAELGKYLYITY